MLSAAEVSSACHRVVIAVAGKLRVIGRPNHTTGTKLGKQYLEQSKNPPHRPADDFVSRHARRLYIMIWKWPCQSLCRPESQVDRGYRSTRREDQHRDKF